MFISRQLALQICIGCLSCYSAYLFVAYKYIFLNDITSEKILPSSVWCNSNQFGHKKCTFRNLYFDSFGNFLFVLTNRSIISGITSKEDFKNINAASVLNHNRMNLRISIIISDTLRIVKYVNSPIFLLWRFKPDNIMHVIHDDLLPLFLTYNDLCLGNVVACVSKYTLAFIDGIKEQNFIKWYKLFSHGEPIYLSTTSKNYTLCLREAYVGLSVDSVFFQYGFKVPQGPVSANVSVLLINGFTDFILNGFGINRLSNLEEINCSFMTRVFSRKILNENDVSKYIELVYSSSHADPIHIHKMDLATNSISELLQIISSSKFMVGMHGSAMILAIFLPQGGTVLELFPFGISPKHVSPVYSMSKIGGIHFKYNYWCNKNKNLTLPHPEYPPLLGGINHLSETLQNEIKSSNYVPPVECCHNPLYLYRMFQDTYIDDSITKPLQKMFYEELNATNRDELNILLEKWYFPGPVINLKCHYPIKNVVQILWEPPVNVNNLPVQYKVTYSIMETVSTIVTHSVFVEIKVIQGKKVQVWISCISKVGESITSYFEC